MFARGVKPAVKGQVADPAGGAGPEHVPLRFRPHDPRRVAYRSASHEKAFAATAEPRTGAWA
jgi:hypothetical protein